MNHAVKLLAAPGYDPKRSRRHCSLRQLHRLEVSLPIGSGESQPGAKHRSSVLEAVPRLVQILDTRVGWDNPTDLFANGIDAVESQFVGPLRTHKPGNLQKDLPLRAGLADPRPRNLGTEYYPPLRAGLCNSSGDFVTGGRRQQHTGIRRLKQHLRRKHNVLVNPERDGSEGAFGRFRIRHYLTEITSHRPQYLQLTSARSLE